MAVALRPVAALEPVIWPTGEHVEVRRPNVYAARVWDTDVVGKPDAMRDGLVAYVAMVCPSKTAEQIAEECDDEFLWLVANYSRDRLEQAQAFLLELAGKALAGTAPASPPPTSTGTSPVASLGPTAVPCGT
jgi:hypothetical protein